MENLHESFKIIYEELDYWVDRRRKNNFFELVFVLEGEGEQCVNGLQYSYRKGSVFLLPATDCHTYQIASKTKFLFIRFTSSYFLETHNSVVDYSAWFNKLHFMIGNYNRLPGELVKDAVDKETVGYLFRIVLNEFLKGQQQSSALLKSSVFSILEIVTRNMSFNLPKESDVVDSRFLTLLHFIQFHLLDEEKITVRYLSDKFNIASTYFSEYFKRNADESFQEYVLKSKLKIAEAKVLYATQSFKEIANDLGFTDSSHLNKMMRKVYNRSLADIRRGNLALRN